MEENSCCINYDFLELKFSLKFLCHQELVTHKDFWFEEVKGEISSESESTDKVVYAQFHYFLVYEMSFISAKYRIPSTCLFVKNSILLVWDIHGIYILKALSCCESSVKLNKAHFTRESVLFLTCFVSWWKCLV